MTRTALVVGATGLVGGHVLDLLAADARWSRVVVLARRASQSAHAKVTEHIVDFDVLAADTKEKNISLDGVDDVFACLGTTIKVAGSQERFRHVDHDYTVTVARLAHAAGARRLALVSSIGASESSSTFYLRVKGETERDVRALGFDSVVVARPSFLAGERSKRRPGERVGIALLNAVAPLMFGGLRGYRPIAAHDVARAMIEAVAAGQSGERVLVYEDLVARS